MLWLFIGFVAGVLVLWLVTLGWDISQSTRKRLDPDEDRAMAAVVFGLGILHAVISAAVRLLVPAKVKSDDRAKLAAVSAGCAVVAWILCEVPALFGLAYVFLGGDVARAGFFFMFAITCMAGHYAARVRP